MGEADQDTRFSQISGARSYVCMNVELGWVVRRNRGPDIICTELTEAEYNQEGRTIDWMVKHQGMSRDEAERRYDRDPVQAEEDRILKQYAH